MKEGVFPKMLQKLNKKVFRNQKGFTLIEIIIAVSILAIISVGLTGAFRTSFQAMVDAKDRTIASNYAQQRMEVIKNNISQINSEYEFDEYLGEDDKYHLVVNVTSDPTDISLNRVTTNVSWQDRNGKTKNVEFEMLIYNPETQGAPVEPDVTSVQLVSYPEEPICCEPVVITAEVYEGSGEDKKLINYGVMVSFQTTQGTLSAMEAFTHDGIATVNLTKLNSLNTPAIITAMVGALSDNLTVDCTPPELTLDAEPTIIFEGESSFLTAVLTDSEGSGLSGKEIKFIITFGNGFINGEGTEVSVLTNAEGEAVVELTGVDPGNHVAIEASYCGVSDTATVDCTELNIEVSADNNTIPPNFETNIVAVLTDGFGNPVSGKTILFTTSNWNIEVISSITDSNGEATAELSDSSVGVATITATVQDTTVSDTVTVECVEMILSVEATPNLVKPDETSTITATLKDSSSGNPLVGKNITFISDSGTLSSDNAPTNYQGEASVTIEFTEQETGEHTITAQYFNLSEDVSVICTNYEINLERQHEEVEAGDPCTITASLTDGSSPVSGKTINFSSDYGTLYQHGSTTITVGSAVTDGNGQARVDLIFSEDETGQTATITGRYINTEPVFEISDTAQVDCGGNTSIEPGPITLLTRSYWFWTYYIGIEIEFSVIGSSFDVNRMEVSWSPTDSTVLRTIEVRIDTQPVFTTVYNNTSGVVSGTIIDVINYTLSEGNYIMRLHWYRSGWSGNIADMRNKNFTIRFYDENDNEIYFEFST